MVGAKGETAVIAMATVAGVRELDVLVFVIANPLAAALGFRQLACLAAEPTAGPRAFGSGTGPRAFAMSAQDSPGPSLSFSLHVDLRFPPRSSGIKLAGVVA